MQYSQSRWNGDDMPIRPISTNEQDIFANLGVNHARHTITFLDDTTPVAVFTVTGSVIVNVLAVCTTDVESAIGCNAELGIAGATDHFIATTDVTVIEDGDIWHDAAPDSDIELLSVAPKSIIAGGADIFLTLSAQMDSGVVEFHCFWTALSADGLVVAA